MKFDGVNLALRIFDGGDGVLRTADGSKAGRQPHDVVAVTVPDAQRVRKLHEKLGLVSGAIDIQNGATVFTTRRRLHFPAQVIGEPLHAVADSQHWDAERKNGWVAFGSLRIIDRAGSPGEHDACWFEFADFIERGRAWENGGKDLLFADAASDELRVLAAEVENDYAAELGVGPLVLLLHLDSAGHLSPSLHPQRRKDHPDNLCRVPRPVSRSAEKAAARPPHSKKIADLSLKARPSQTTQRPNSRACLALQFVSLRACRLCAVLRLVWQGPSGLDRARLSQAGPLTSRGRR